jgi:hypothetical protein
MLSTTLREKIELGMLKISRSKERIVVRYLSGGWGWVGWVGG